MKRNLSGTMFAGVVLVISAALIGACSEKIEPMSEVTVNIEYNNKGCPKKVDRDITFWKDFELGKSNRIIWQTAFPNASYTIYFDPFQKEPLKSVNGKVTATEFTDFSPLAEYKYTIVDDKCKDEPLDPRFRLR